MTRRFTFGGSWTVAEGPARVQQVLLDLEHYPEWWPQVRAVAKIDDDHARVLCRSTLPYTLDLVLTAVRREPEVLETRLSGDLAGWVRWRITAEDGGTRLVFEQDVLVAGRLLGLVSLMLRGPLTWNHDRMMAGCRDGLAAFV